MRLARRACALVLLTGLAAVSLFFGEARAFPRADMVTSAGLVRLTVTNLGYFGNGLALPYQPSCEYPPRSHVEHVFMGGIWVGAVAADGSIRVSCGAQDASSLSDGESAREFSDTIDPADQVQRWSNRQNSDDYDPRALATEHYQMAFRDNVTSPNHVPLGLKVVFNVLDWGNSYADDYVILDYAVVNESGTELRDVYVGLWIDTTVGNTEQTDPYDPNAAVRWNYYDDVNGAWGPSGDVADSLGLPAGLIPEGSQVADDRGIWLTYERDFDGEGGMATSWVGNRYLGSQPPPQPAAGHSPVSYNAWTFRHVPARDSWYRGYQIVGNDTIWDEELSPGKYQVMGNGAFTVGQTGGVNYTIPTDWIQLLSVGPFPYLAPGDTLRAAYAIVCAADSLSLLANSKVAQVAYDRHFALPSGPPSPRLEVATDWNSVVLSWEPGVATDEDGAPLANDDPRRSPEHHISTTTGKLDFQGYRVYRHKGDQVPEDPYAASEVVAEYDKIDGIGFDTGLPPLDGEGRRVFAIDRDLLDGFPYVYSVVSFSAPDPDEGLPSFESGFSENDVVVYPGSPSVSSAAVAGVNVVPNPYRAASAYDDPGKPETGRRIWFTNLPPRCSIQIFSLAGDLVRTLHHDDPNDGKQAWDVLSEYSRAIASGLYVYVVTNQDSGEVQRGKLVIVK